MLKSVIKFLNEVEWVKANKKAKTATTGVRSIDPSDATSDAETPSTRIGA
jgi:hypothetical protein